MFVNNFQRENANTKEGRQPENQTDLPEFHYLPPIGVHVSVMINFLFVQSVNTKIIINEHLVRLLGRQRMIITNSHLILLSFNLVHPVVASTKWRTASAGISSGNLPTVHNAKGCK